MGLNIPHDSANELFQYSNKAFELNALSNKLHDRKEPGSFSLYVY